MDFAFVLGAVPAGESSLFDDVSPEEFFDELNDLFASDPLGPLDELDAELQRLSDRAADDGDVARTKVVPPASPPLTFSPRDELAEVSMVKNVVLFEENSILQLPECLEASGVKFSWSEVSQESPKNQ